MFLLLVAAALAAPPDWVEAPALQADPQALLAAAAERTGDAPLEILYEDVRFTFGADRTVTRSGHLVYLLRDPSEVPYWTRVDAAWSPWFQARPDIAARVIRPDGEVAQLDPGTIVEEAGRDADATLLDDRRVAHAPLPRLVPGSVVEVLVTDRPTAPFGPGGATAREAAPTGERAWPMRVTFEAPARLPLDWSGNQLATTPTVTVKGGTRRVVYEVEPQLEPYHRGDWSPPSVPVQPFVEASAGASWEAESAAYFALVADRLTADPAVLRPLLDAAGSRAGADRIEALLQAVRTRVRYTGVEFGESAIVPAAPAEVLARGWGDCKEQAALLVALLGAAGVPAEMALVRPGPADDVSVDHPGLGSFTHAIVHVPGPDELWIDPSVPQVGARETPLAEIAHHALVIRRDGGALLEIPSPSADADASVTTLEARLTPGRPLAVEAHVTGRGVLVSTVRPPWGKDASAFLRETYSNAGMGGTFTSARHTGVARTDEPFDVTLTGAGDTPLYEDWRTAAPLATVLVLPREILGGTIDDARTAPYLLLPNTMEQVVRVRIPEGYVLAEAPEPLHFASQGVSLDVTRRRDGEVEELHLRARVERALLPVADARALSDALAPVLADFTGTMRVMAESAKLVSDDRPSDGVARARALLSAHPDEAVWHALLGAALDKGGFRDAAQVELAAAAALAPDDARLAGRQAASFLSDPFARTLSPPWDAVAGRTLTARCIALDPTLAPCRYAHAYALAAGTDGRLFGDGAALPELEAWAASVTDLQTPLTELRLKALLRLGAFADAKKAAVKAGETGLAVVAATLGESQAAGVAMVLRTGEAGRWRLAKEAADELVELRRYPEAHAVAAAGLGKSTVADRVAYVDGLAKRRRWEDAADLPPAGQVVLRFLHGVGTGASRADLGALASADVLGFLDPRPDRYAFWSTIRPLVARWIGSDSPDPGEIDRALDAILATGTFTTEGDDKRGWKVTIRGTDWRRPIRVLLAKGRKGPEVRAFTLVDETVSAEALRRVKAGDTAGAAWWIDAWQQDEATGEDGPLAAQYRTSGDADPTTLTTAAAMLSATGDPAGLPILEQAFQRDTGARRVLVGRRLVAGLLVAGRWDAVGPVVDALLSEKPNDSGLVRAKVSAALALGKGAEVKPLLDAAVAARPRDVWLRSAAVEMALAQGDPQPAADALVAALDSGDLTSSELNEAAWTLLFVPGREAKALALAERAVGIKGASDATRHTLAMCQLANGKYTAAVETLQAEVQKSGDASRLPAYWWLVRGSLAEAWGLRDEAIAAYRKVPVEPGGGRFRSDRWAAERIAALGG